MEFIVVPDCLDISDYIDQGCRNFLLSLKDFSVESKEVFSLDEIQKIRTCYGDIHIWVNVNKNMFNDELETLKDVLIQLDQIGITGVFYYDAAVISLYQQLNLSYHLVWSQTHMVTNSKTCDYYQQLGVRYALLSKEITKDEILEIVDQSKIIPIIEILSYPSVAFSRRKLLTHYFKDLKKMPKNEIFIHEDLSKQDYIVREDHHGTSFIKQNMMNGLSILDELIDHGVKYVLLREDYIDHDLFLQIIDRLNEYIIKCKNLSTDQKKKWQEEIERLIGNDTNFFFKKTIYKVR